MEYYTKSYIEYLERQIEELREDRNTYMELCEKYRKLSDDLFDILRFGGDKDEETSD